MKKIGMGLIGPGFVDAHHIDAVRRLGDVDVVAIAGSSQESTERKAKALKIDRAYRSTCLVEAMLKSGLAGGCLAAGRVCWIAENAF